jgi:hypothetical protein
MAKREKATEVEVLEREAAQEVREQHVAAVTAAAVKAIQGAVTFSIDGAMYKVPEEAGRMSYAVQQTEMKVFGHIRQLELDIADIFAPEAYTDITSERHKALRRFLEITSPIYMVKFERVQELSNRAKRGSKLPPLTQQESYELDGARGALMDAKRAINRTYDTLKTHFDKRMAAETGDAKPRNRTSPRGLIDKTIAALQKQVESTKTPEADKDVAKLGLNALRWAMSNKDDFTQQYLQYCVRMAAPHAAIAK